MRKFFIGGIALISTVFFLSSYAYAGSLSFSWTNQQPEAATQKVVSGNKNGPPTHAPAHGYRSKRQYQYFPSCSVYHDAHRGLFFYLSGSFWQVAASLPHDLKMQLGNHVSIEMDTDKPYIYHDQHKKQYPPGQMKKINKEKGNKWVKK
ncbi:hypothetical protein [Desulfosarcina sp.]|uniref:hypothetical protein n=1 Tax=Desulfosarcina sp. TaxID=2027861 RepID=UPI003970487B